MKESSARWMWYPGDYEIYHSLLLHIRREHRDHFMPTIWPVQHPSPNVRFQRTAAVTQKETIIIHKKGQGYCNLDAKRYPLGIPMVLEPGEHKLEIVLYQVEGLPCVYVDSTAFASGEGWESHDVSGEWLPAGFSDAYQAPTDDPQIFPFLYKEIYATATPVAGGTLYDFGQETFARLTFTELTAGEPLWVYYGESDAEALDTGESYLYDCIPGDTTQYAMPPRAFRYLFLPENSRRFTLKAEEEYLPLTYRGAFSCSDEKMNRIWQVAARTLHLNSREFFLDGIKRDRWVWSGDAYQSYLINYYLFFDQDLVKRTTYALRGKEHMTRHINVILDYSLYWVIGIGDYLLYTGDLDFVGIIWNRLTLLLDYCAARCDEKGFIIGEEKDWVFIDWHDIDKTGAACAEQMLLLKAYEVAAHCAELLKLPATAYLEKAKQLRAAVVEYFWREEKGAFIDSFSSGKEKVTRHANIFALLFEVGDERMRARILEQVLNNPEIPPITTPYFQFYELEAWCKTGQFEKAYEKMRAYWGGMLDLGATSIWEEYDPRMSGNEHYRMYSGKYEKSLCHAWGASPIYLLGRYFLGVSPTETGYKTFRCTPHLTGLKQVEGTVPLPNGTVKLSLSEGVLRLSTDCKGGTVVYDGKEYPLVPGEVLTLAAL